MIFSSIYMIHLVYARDEGFTAMEEANPIGIRGLVRIQVEVLLRGLRSPRPKSSKQTNPRPTPTDLVVSRENPSTI